MLNYNQWGVLESPPPGRESLKGAAVQVIGGGYGHAYTLATPEGRLDGVPKSSLSPLPDEEPRVLPARGSVKRLHAAWPTRFTEWRQNRVCSGPALPALEAELAAIKADFGANGPVKVSSRLAGSRFRWSVSFVTERIVLGHDEGVAVDLGPFRVSVGLSMYINSSEPPTPTRKVTALEPHYPAGYTRRPHPHVRGTHICLGGGEAAFNAAVQSGRLSDAAIVVASVLRTYHEASAYVRISMKNWDGAECGNCGARHPPRNTIPDCPDCGGGCCTACRSTYCGRCMRFMHEGCAAAVPLCAEPGCVSRVCSACGDTQAPHGRWCRSHLKRCQHCWRNFPPPALVGKFCPECAAAQAAPEVTP